MNLDILWVPGTIRLIWSHCNFIFSTLGMSQSKKTRPSKLFREKETNFRDSVISKLQTLSNKVSVVLVGPKYSGNIGAVSRSMNNAGLHDLVIIGRDDIPEEAYVYGMHSTDILFQARQCNW